MIASAGICIFSRFRTQHTMDIDMLHSTASTAKNACKPVLGNYTIPRIAKAGIEGSILGISLHFYTNS